MVREPTPGGHLTHPSYPELMTALKEKQEDQVARVMAQMSRDGWREYLKSVRTTDVSAFFWYLAREDGRKPRRRNYSCEAPLIDVQGVRHFSGPKKCAMLADHFECRLGANSSELQETRPAKKKSNIMTKQAKNK